MERIVAKQGLTTAQVEASRRLNGANTTQADNRSVFGQVLWGIVKEPMFLLLVVTCAIYFLLSQTQDAFIMLGALLLVSGISLFQDYRSSSALKALNKLAAPRTKVFRNGKQVSVVTEDIVVGDLVVLEEGIIIPADGRLVSSNDLSVNESVLTGESFSIPKSPNTEHEVCKGTLVTSGGGIMEVGAVGQRTQFGRIGQSLTDVEVEKTPLQRQIHSFVRRMVLAGVVAFLVVVGMNLYLSGHFNEAFLQGLTLAMSILPEEIPVAFTTFQALGAYRLSRKQVIVKQPQYVETLGTATVICVDKTGTLTQNKMQIVALFDASTDRMVKIPNNEPIPPKLVEYAMWSSETAPFDPMEKAIHTLYAQTATTDLRTLFDQVHEYPLGGVPPMMTHVFRNAVGRTVIATKGAPEAVLRCSHLTEADRQRYLQKSKEFASQGYRVLAVGGADGDYPELPTRQEDFVFTFLGLIVFEDPIKPGIAYTISTFRQAGIQVKMITGDHAETAMSIAGQAGIEVDGHVIKGEDVMNMSPADLQRQVMSTAVFVRMFPEAKLKVVNALKAKGEVVAMTGDGVNDAPALKAAHIGIAMGQRGSEVARNAASLILANDDLAGMTDAVFLGRKIYDNLKKAIRYIISIHIPIILIVTIPLLLGWSFTGIFFPVHVIFLELIMGPTCSIIYENEPAEPDTMQRPPRKTTFSFLTFRQLLLSILQGLGITVGCLMLGYYFLQAGYSEAVVRTLIFITLIFCNIFLTQLNRSFLYSVLFTIRYNNRMVWFINLLTLLCMACLLFVPAIRDMFSLSQLTGRLVLTCLGVAFASTWWFEVVKFFIRRKAGTAKMVNVV